MGRVELGVVRLVRTEPDVAVVAVIKLPAGHVGALRDAVYRVPLVAGLLLHPAFLARAERRDDPEDLRVPVDDALDVELVRPAILPVGPGRVPAARIVAVRRMLAAELLLLVLRDRRVRQQPVYLLPGDAERLRPEARFPALLTAYPAGAVPGRFGGQVFRVDAAAERAGAEVRGSARVTPRPSAPLRGAVPSAAVDRILSRVVGGHQQITVIVRGGWTGHGAVMLSAQVHDRQLITSWRRTRSDSGLLAAQWHASTTGEYTVRQRGHSQSARGCGPAGA